MALLRAFKAEKSLLLIQAIQKNFSSFQSIENREITPVHIIKWKAGCYVKNNTVGTRERN
jgi:hypothetical protein